MAFIREGLFVTRLGLACSLGDFVALDLAFIGVMSQLIGILLSSSGIANRRVAGFGRVLILEQSSGCAVFNSCEKELNCR